MKLVLQRVSSASVVVDGKVTGEIGKGYLILLGVGAGDGESEIDGKTKVEKLVNKISKQRIFSDEDGKINLSIGDVDGELLVVSQFTLYADCSKNRPSFTKAAPPDLAEYLYEYFLSYARDCGNFKRVESGVFGAYMQVKSINDGPFTLCYEM
ncbi:MAG: D-aminoacyl-tRNA deacylase [Oscillospiraceae bacterium]|nr:D-aminoacyl-tRNA deacylase [Oscillospiraceae bacterium]